MKRTVFWWFGSLFCLLSVATIVAAEEGDEAPRATVVAPSLMDEPTAARSLELDSAEENAGAELVAPANRPAESADGAAAGRTLGQRIFNLDSADATEKTVEDDGKSHIRILRAEDNASDSPRNVPAEASDANADGHVTPAEELRLGSGRIERAEAASESEPAIRVRANEPRELSPEMVELRGRIRQCLSHYYTHPETTAARSPWAVMHAFIGFGVDTQLIAGDRPVNAIAWTCWNGPCYGMRLFYADGGYVVPRIGPGYQGHPGQFMAMMAQCKVKSDYAMKVDGHDFTIRDLIEYEMVTCKAKTELTFKLIGLSHYLDTDARWKDEHGGDWDIERLISEELRQPVIGGTCGGTHRMMGFTYAVKKRTDRGEPIDGQWQRAEKYIADYHAYTFKLQNDDGSFSTNWFEGRGDTGGIDRRLQTTGHILEWFVASLPQEQLSDPRVIHAVNYLTNLMLENRDHYWEIGPKGHAIHALCIYDERVFGGKPGQRAIQLAGRGSRAR